MSGSANYQPHVDGLRAVAVLAVLLFHLGVGGFGGGFVGVDVFLVISGFLITRLIVSEVEQTGTFRFGAFYLRRIRRLAPALLATSAATLVAGALLFSPEMLARTGKETVAAILSVSNFRFWNEADYFDVSASTKPLLHTWSLSLEEQFYLLWPAFLVMLARSRAKRALPAVLAVLAVASLALNPMFANGAPAWMPRRLSAFDDGKSTIFFLLPFRVFEFAIGGLLVWCGGRKPARAWVADAGLVAGLAMIGVATALFDEEMLFPSFAALLPCVGAALAIHCGDRSRLHAILTNPACVGIGLISYSLYLVHWPLIVAWASVSGPLGSTEQLWIGALSLALGYASYRFVETPFRHRTITLKPVAFLAPALVALAVQVGASGGWPWRIQTEIAVDLSKGALEFHRAQYGGAGYGSGMIAGKGCPDIILVGDSHAKQYAEGLVREFAEPRGLTVHMQAGTSCLHMPGFVRTTKGIDWQDRLQKELDAIRAVIDGCEKKPTVVLAHSWLEQMKRSVPVSADGARLERPVTQDDIIDGLGRLKEFLGVDRLVVIGNVPLPRVRNIFEELTKPSLSRRYGLADLSTFAPREDVTAFNGALAAAAAANGTFAFIDPCAALCTADGCLAIDPSGELVYSDATHLSKFGSRKTVRDLAPRLAAGCGLE